MNEIISLQYFSLTVAFQGHQNFSVFSCQFSDPNPHWWRFRAVFTHCYYE